MITKTIMALAVLTAAISVAPASDKKSLVAQQPPSCPGCVWNRLSKALYGPWWLKDGWYVGLNGVYGDGILVYPNYDGIVYKVTVPVNYVSGTNAVNVAVYSDAGGLPGSVLATKQFTNLPALGSCCTPIVWKTNVPVTQGVPVWVVVSVNGGTEVVWNYDVTDQVDPVTAAYNDGSGWTSFSALPSMAGRVQAR